MPVTNPSLQILNDQDVLERLRDLRRKQPVKYVAFYSSQLGGIVTDPALMVLPFDDHMVHRGHGVFDTAAIVSGKIYDLEAHLDRFVRPPRPGLPPPGGRGLPRPADRPPAAPGGCVFNATASTERGARALHAALPI